jgi:hypothetical protein
VRAQVLAGREIRLAGQQAKREAALAAARREMAKSMVVKEASASRYVALTMGRRMAAEGLIDRPEEKGPAAGGDRASPDRNGGSFRPGIGGVPGGAASP